MKEIGMTLLFIKISLSLYSSKGVAFSVVCERQTEEGDD